MTTLEATMTKGERDELKSLAKQRARVAKAGIEMRQAELRADVEAQLSAIYKPTEEAWADLAAEAMTKVQALDGELAQRCQELGIQADLRPSLRCDWYGRGDNADKIRRAELRMAATRRIEAEGRAAKVRIDEATLEVLTELAAGALTSGQAKQFLQGMPTLAQLMPPLDVRELEAGKP